MNFSTEPTPCTLEAELNKICPGFEAEKQAILDVFKRYGVSSEDLQLKITREALFSQSVTAFLQHHGILASDAPTFWTKELIHCVLPQKGKVKLAAGAQFQDRAWLRKACNALGLIYTDKEARDNYNFRDLEEKLFTVCVPCGWIFDPHRPVQRIEVCSSCDKTIHRDGSIESSVYGNTHICHLCGIAVRL